MPVLIKRLSILLTIVIFNCTPIAEVLPPQDSSEIPKQALTMNFNSQSPVFSETLMPGEIADTDIEHIAIIGPYSHLDSLTPGFDDIFIFLKGTGNLIAEDTSFAIVPESIGLPLSVPTVTLEVSEGNTLHYVHIQKKLSAQDQIDLKRYPTENRHTIYFRSFEECTAYTEKIKSPNTVSRTVLPKDHIPRVAQGTVVTMGPDAVGAHEHPMLDQLFLGLGQNDVTVFADDKSIAFKEFEILHIPIGASHWVTVDEGKIMNYQWMDFFLTKKGEEWLKTHKQTEDY